MPATAQAWGSSFDDVADQVRVLMREIEGKNWFRAHAPDAWRPRINLYETLDRYVICVELAAVNREDIDLCVARGALYIRGTRKRPVIPGDATNVSVHLMEIDSGRFHRKLQLPRDVHVEEITATCRHGFLWITLPRTGSPGSSES